MNVTCSSCNTQYKIDETKVPASGGFIKCKTCGERVKIPPPGGAIPLAGTEAPPPPSPAAGAIPLAGTEAPPAPSPAAAGAIPLAGTEAPPAPSPAAAGAIPLAGTEAPAPSPAIPPAGTNAPPQPPATPTPAAAGAAIPLAGTAPQPATGAIPLAGTPSAPTPSIPLAGSMPPTDESDDEAPTVVTTSPMGAIPLAGSHDAATVVADTPSLPRTESAIPLAGSAPAPVDDEAPTVVAQTPSLPRTEPSVPDDEAPTAIGPAPVAPPTNEDAATQITETPRFLDNVPPTSDALDDLPATLSAEDTAGITEPDAPALPLDTGMDSGLFDDLPTAAAEEVPSLDLADLPATDGPSLMDDLPMADGAAPSLMDDLPMAEQAAPSLMDDLPIEDGPRDDTSVSGLDGEAMTSPSAPELMLELDDPLDAQQSSAPAMHPADLGMPAAEPAAPAPDTAAAEQEGTPRGKGRIIAIAAVGAAIVVLAAVALTTPYLGVQLADPFGLVETVVVPDPVPQTKAKTKAKAKAKAPEPKPEPEPERVELTAENVDTLDYAALRESTTALATAGTTTENKGLLAWARFRLAAIYGDDEARQALIAGLPKRPQEIPKLEGLRAAAAVGGLALAGKAGPARKVGERMAKGRHKDSVQLAIALSSTYTKRPEAPKAMRHLDRAHKLAPDLPDITLRRAQLMLAGKDPRAGAEMMAKLATSANDPDLIVQVIGSLLAAEQPSLVADVAAGLTDSVKLERIAPQRRDLALRLSCYQAIHIGDLEKAVELAKKRVAKVADLSPRIELARLTAAAGGDGDAVLNETTAENLAPADSARIVAEHVRLALGKGDLDAAKAALEKGGSLPAKKTGGWLKLADGWIASHEKRGEAATTAFNAAAKKLPEARLEVALLGNDDKVLMKKLSELEKKLPAAAYHLARLMTARGNPRGAAQLLARVSWTDPTVIHPIALVLEWAEAVALSGQPEQAMATIASLREKQPDDIRPTLALIELKRGAGAHDEVVELYRALVASKPKKAVLKVGLAAALNRAGAHSQAQGLLDDLFKQDKKARTPEALVELARAWADREPYRARQLVKESIDSEATAEKYMLLGALAEKRDQIDEARKAYNKALELDPRTVQAHVALAHIDLESRGYDQVITGLEKVLAQVPNHREAATILGDVYVETGKPQEAIKRYQIALSTGEDEQLLMKVARLQLHRLGQLPPAIKTLRRLIAINPKIAEAHFHLGMALKDQGQKRDAVASLKKCLALEPEGEWAKESKTTIQDLQK